MEKIYVCSGHFIQVFHIGMIGGLSFLVGVGMRQDKRWAFIFPFIWIITVFLSGIICSGCPITLASNYYFGLGGHAPYASIERWLANQMPLPFAISLALAIVIVQAAYCGSFWIGHYASRRNGVERACSLLRCRLPCFSRLLERVLL